MKPVLWEHPQPETQGARRHADSACRGTAGTVGTAAVPRAQRTGMGRPWLGAGSPRRGGKNGRGGEEKPRAAGGIGLGLNQGRLPQTHSFLLLFAQRTSCNDPRAAAGCPALLCGFLGASDRQWEDWKADEPGTRRSRV